MRHRKNLYDLIDSFNNKDDIDWDYWKNRELRILCKYFVEKKFCRAYKDNLEQYLAFHNIVSSFWNDKENMLSQAVIKSPGLKNYLQLHSVFKIDVKRKGDWLNKAMLKILEVTDLDMQEIYKEKPIPQEILKKLAIFDPEPIGIEVDPIRIEYDFWGLGGPIKIIDTDWESMDIKTVDVTSFLSQYEHIDTKTNIVNSYTTEELIELDNLSF